MSGAASKCRRISLFRLAIPQTLKFNDHNLIEQVVSKRKRLLGKAEARTIDTICANIGSLPHHFNADERAAYLRNSGYASIWV